MGIKPCYDSKSTFALAYDCLRALQKKKQNWVYRAEINLILQTTPGITFEPRTTLEEAVKKLENWGILNNLGEDRFYVSLKE